MEPMKHMPTEALPVEALPVRLRDAVNPALREIDAGSAAWAGVIAPLLGALGYLIENTQALEAVLRAAGVPPGVTAGVLFGLGVLYAAITRSRKA